MLTLFVGNNAPNLFVRTLVVSSQPRQLRIRVHVVVGINNCNSAIPLDHSILAVQIVTLGLPVAIKAVSISDEPVPLGPATQGCLLVGAN